MISTVFFWLWLATSLVTLAAMMVAGLLIRELYALREDDRNHFFSFRTQFDTALSKLSDRVAHWEESQDHAEEHLNDLSNDIEERLTRLGKELADRVDRVHQGAVGLHADALGEIDKAIKTASEKTLREAHRAIWDDLDGSLTTMRADFDASLNQRTNSLTKYVDNAVLYRGGPAPASEPEGWARFREMVEDHNDRMAVVEERLDTIDADIADLADEPEPAPQPETEPEPATNSRVDECLRRLKEEILKTGAGRPLDDLAADVAKRVVGMFRR